MDQRPELNKKIKLSDFKDFYWLKKELTDFCRGEGLSSSGSKLELANRIEVFLTTGLKNKRTTKATKAKSTFDWSKEKLIRATMITDNYKNTQNVRAFFEKEIGPSFKFNVTFMNWIKENAGQSLASAIKQWYQIKEDHKARQSPKEIAPQFEYNRYIRDFLVDNPGQSRSQAISFWKLKKSRRGSNAYDSSDLDLT